MDDKKLEELITSMQEGACVDPDDADELRRLARLGLSVVTDEGPAAVAARERMQRLVALGQSLEKAGINAEQLPQVLALSLWAEQHGVKAMRYFCTEAWTSTEKGVGLFAMLEALAALPKSCHRGEES